MADTDTSRDSRDSESAHRRARRPQGTGFPETIGSFHTRRKLKSGGQGTVYEAFDPELQRVVAVKLLHGGRDDDQALLAEAQATAKLTGHKNVVTIFRTGSWNGQVFIAMEFLPGGTLREWVEHERRPVADIVARFTDAAHGLAAIHAQGLVHRDFKPENVLLREDGSVAVADFGLARALSDQAASHSGTRRYMAPELLANGAATPASDQFAFCVALYWALTRRFPSETGAVTFPPDTPTWLRRILLRGLQRDPSARYESMRALLRDLENTPEVRRRALLRGLLVFTAVGALTAAGIVFWRSETPSQRALRECTEGVSAARSALWSPARVEEAQRNFTALAGAAGTQAFERARQRIDPHVDAWEKTSLAACAIKEPFSQRSTQSCLEVRRATLGAIVDYLSTTKDATLVRDVLLTLSRELKPVEACLQSAVLSQDLPESPEERELRVQLAPARVLRAAGRLDEARSVASTVAISAEGAPRVRAEALLFAAQMRAEAGDPTAPTYLASAIDAADAVGNDELRAQGYVTLVSFHASRREIPSAEAAQKRARAIVTRLGSPPLLQAPLVMSEGNFEYARGRLPEAQEKYREWRALLAVGREANDPMVLRADNNLLLSGAPEQRAEGFEALTQLTLRELGPTHPETLFTRHNLASALLADGQCQRAEEILSDLITLRLAGPPHLQRALATNYGLRARVRECLGQRDLAIADQEENLKRLKSFASDNTLYEELKWQFEEKAAARRPKAELDALRHEICVRGFASPDQTECPHP